MTYKLYSNTMNVFITNLKEAGLGCWVRQMFIGCLLYADAIILLSPSISGLQEMLDICYKNKLFYFFTVQCGQMPPHGPWSVGR